MCRFGASVPRMAHRERDPSVMKEQYVQALASAVRAEAAAKEVSRAELARMINVEKGVIYRYMRGEREFPLSILYEVAEALGTTVDDLASEAYRRMP